MTHTGDTDGCQFWAGLHLWLIKVAPEVGEGVAEAGVCFMEE
jgi:hypothetical protein